MRLCENQLYGLVMELRRGRSDRNHVTFKRSDTLAHNIVKVAWSHEAWLGAPLDYLDNVLVEYNSLVTP